MEPSFYLSDHEYARALDTLVIACVDTIVLCEGKLLLGMRKKLPNDSWWFFGGRMIKGEAIETSACRSLMRELGLEIAKNRIKKIDCYSLVWPTRREEPVNNGCHHLLNACYVEISRVEKNKIVSGEDHEELAWFDFNRLPAESHDYLKQISSDLKRILSSR